MRTLPPLSSRVRLTKRTTGRRIDRNHNAHLVDIIQGKFSSSFFTEAKDEWESKGARKMNNAMSEWGSFEVEQPG